MMRIVLLATLLLLCLSMKTASAQSARNDNIAAAATLPDSRLCSWDGKKYSLGAVVTKDNKAFRCSDVHVDELNVAAVAGWVELSKALAPMK